MEDLVAAAQHHFVVGQLTLNFSIRARLNQESQRGETLLESANGIAPLAVLCMLASRAYRYDKRVAAGIFCLQGDLDIASNSNPQGHRGIVKLRDRCAGMPGHGDRCLSLGRVRKYGAGTPISGSWP